MHVGFGPASDTSDITSNPYIIKLYELLEPIVQHHEPLGSVLSGYTLY